MAILGHFWTQIYCLIEDPNKGNAFEPIFLDLIKATPNKGNAFEPNLSKTIVATLLLFGWGGYPLFEHFLAF